MDSAVKSILKASIAVYNKRDGKEELIKYIEQKLKEFSEGRHVGKPYAINQVAAAAIFLRIYKPRPMTKTKKVDHAQRAHALLSASGASRWIACTPSPRLEENFPDKSSTFAEEGTLAHEFAELNLKHELNLISSDVYQELAGPHFKSEYYSGDMMDHVQKHIDYVIEQFNEAKRQTPDAILLIEQRVDITHLVEEGFGTCDVIIIADGVLEVIDLKYGLGVRVSAEDNSQLKLYGSGALEAYEMLYDIHTVRLTVTQPRMDSISSWEISADDLRQWGEEVVKPKAQAAYAGEGEQVPGEHCRFCKASARCKAQAKIATETAKEDFTDLLLLTDEELVNIYKKAPQIEAWLKSVAGYMFNEALSGKSWPDHKLVDGQNRRGWTDEREAARIIGGTGLVQSAYLSEPKLKGITEIEKLVGKKKFPDLLGDVVAFKKTSPSLVHVSDKRQAMSSIDNLKSDFE